MVPTPNTPAVLVADFSVLLPGLYLGGALLVGAVVIAVVSRWRRTNARTPTSEASDQLAQFRSLYERGEISQEEFDRLRALLGGQLRAGLVVPPPKPAPPR